MDTNTIETEVRAALHAAAAQVHPQSSPLPTAAAGFGRPQRSSRRRWLAPAVAAAVVTAIGVPVVLMSTLRGGGDPGVAAAKPGASDIAAASVVKVSGGRASVAGIGFPLPDGWTAKTVGTTDTSVTVCVAAQPTTACNGVTLRIAVPDAAGRISPVRDPLSAEDPLLRDLPLEPADDAATADPAAGGAAATSTASPGNQAGSSVAPVPEYATGSAGGAPAQSAAGVSASAASTEGTAGTAVPIATTPAKGDFATATCPLIIDKQPIDSRPAVHYSIGYCAPGSPQSADWYILDGSLAVATPRGVANEQAASIVAGMDLSGYRHDFGPQILFFSEPGVASSATGPDPTR